ncbi:MAG: PKD domain-containing protein [Bacteroidia bacterium]
MKQTLRFTTTIFLFLFFKGTIFSQASACPQVTVAPAGPICSGNCVNLTATVQGSVATTSYAVSTIPYSPYSYTTGTPVLINIDDTWSGVINMPFCFQFFGNTYSQIVIGSNSIITFDVTQAGGYCQWPINNAIPSASNPMNSIMAPWQDTDPSVNTPTSATDINWKVVGSAPCREFIVSWNDVAMFSCNSVIATSQMVLHETTNIIDVYIQNKPACTSWNVGAAIEGIQNSTGTLAYAVPGRNFPTQWTAANDGKRFMPTGAPQYTLNWTGPSGSLGSANPITVCPTTTSTYTCTVTNTTCAAPVIVTASTTVVVTAGLTTSGSQTNSTSCTLCNGTATTSVVTGTGPFTYAWLPSGGNAATATNLCPGTYTCTVSNPTGCTGTQIFTITGPTAPTSTQSHTNVSCNGGCNGTATIVPNPAGAYTYVWTPNVGNTATVSGLCAGTFTVVATNAGSCTTTQTITITQPTAVTATQSQTNISCNGVCNGTATVTASGGTPGYTYLWAPSGGTGSTTTSRCAGTYTCTITDANGCAITRTFNITQPSLLTASSSSTPATCGGNSGTVTAAGSGGTPGYTYSWNSVPVQNTATATGLPAGSYTCTVTDANGCTTTTVAVVGSTGGITGSITATTNVSCFGGNTGSATAAPSGGTGPYVYSWNTAPVQTSATATSLAAGSYTCTITDANGCMATVTVTITQPTVVTATQSQVNITCNGACTGSATVVASGGTPGYTYLWAPTGGTGSTTSGRCAGTYTCTITDANGCSITSTFNITQPSAVTATVTIIPSTCGNPNGSATVTPGGGTPGYGYSWNTVPVQTTPTASGLLAGSYTVTVTDLNGCTATAVAVVTNTGGPTASISASANIACFGGSTGSATVSVAGGTGPFSYSWNSTPVQTTATVAGLPAGSYTVTVTDANTCTTTATVTLTQNPAITATQSQVNVLCNSSCTGVATVVASGGTGIYTYAWLPSGGTGASATSLCAGTYTCTISSPSGCSITQSFNITQPPAITSTSTQVNELCNGDVTGSATVNPSGGNPGYTYSWNTSPVQTTATANGLAAGSYTCIITDANLCTFTISVTITQPPALIATTSSVQSTCGNPNGTATVNISGGTPTYTISWSTSPVQTTTTATGLLAGNYTVTVEDANSCSVTATVTVINAGSPTATITSSTDVSCFGVSNGDATVTAGSGTAPYSYSWNTTPVQNTTIATGLSAGLYTVTVTDANACTATAVVTITEPPALTISSSTTDVGCFGNATGTASVIVNGGSPGYSYSWNTSPVQVTANAAAIVAGSYTCTVTDNNGCIITQSVTITEPPQLTIAVAGFNVTCFSACNGQLVVIPNGGTPNYAFSWSTGCNMPSCNNICAGTYTVDVTDANGCLVSASTSVTEPPAIVINTSSVDAHCNLADGSASAIANGGTGALGFQWISGPATANYNNIPANTYSVIVTDANGCSDTATAIVNNLNGVTSTLTSVTNLTCFNSNDGAIVTGTAGGNSPYGYSWSAPAVSATGSAASLPAGTYTLTVTDANGCTATVTTTVTEPAAVTITANSNPTAVCAGTGVQLTAIGGGGTPAYSFAWSPGPLAGNTQNIVPAATTTYTAYVVDANGCSDSTTVLVTVNPLPVSLFTADDLDGCAPLCVNFSDLSSIAAPGIIASGAWDFGDGSPLALLQDTAHCYNTPGSYNVTLNLITTDGCTATLTLPSYITIFANPVAAFGASPQPASILNPLITFTDSSQGAASWSWSFGDLTNASSVLQNPTFTYPDPTCYQVVLAIASSDGCVDTTSRVICINPDVTIYVPNAFTPNDDGVNDIFYPAQIGIDPDEYEMWIFDRWGNMIFYTNDLAKGWDGHVRGASNVIQIDTYVWKIKAKDVLGSKHNIQGKVSIVK